MRAFLMLLCLLAARPAAAEPWAEFEAPYAIRISRGGEAVELFGSFSWAVPQNLSAALARAPNAKVVRLDSPGGHVEAGVQIAAMIRARGLDTDVPRLCASACTIAFLAGKDRTVAPDARLGFHQARAPGVPPSYFDPQLRDIYAKAGVPAPFIDHVLRTPPDQIWFPAQAELVAAGMVHVGPPPAPLPANSVLAWWRAMSGVPAVSEATVESAAATYARLLDALQAAGPESCWGFLHNRPADLRGLLDPDLRDAVAATEHRVAEEARGAPPAFVDTKGRTRILATLLEIARYDGGGPLVSALRTGADHAALCPAVRRLLSAALALPEDQRGQALRFLLISG
jgi:hypothetical protein